MLQDYVQQTLDYFYEEGEHDLLYFGQILGVVSYDQQGRPFAKSVMQRLSDALHLMRFLINSGDFLLWHTVRHSNGKTRQQEFAGRVNDFRALAQDIVQHQGIDDADLNTGYWLRKIQEGKTIQAIPEDIADLFY